SSRDPPRRRRVRVARIHRRRAGPHRDVGNGPHAGGGSPAGVPFDGVLVTGRIGMTQPHVLGPMPTDRRMTTVDELLVRAPLAVIFGLAVDVQRWPIHLAHYRYVRFHERRSDGGGLVEMSANRPFVFGNWPTYWTSLMSVASPDTA